jgi:hypothetical protein
MISKLRVPPGVLTIISEPMTFPIRALPIGDVTEMVFWLISDYSGPTS